MNPYVILGISVDASESEIKKAYKKLANQYHPDKDAGDSEKFLDIQCAYELLSDVERKLHYDTTGEVKSKQNTDKLRAIGQLASMLINIIDNGSINVESTDLLKLMEQRINESIVGNTIEINKLENQIIKRNKAIKRILKQNNEENVLSGILMGDTGRIAELISRYKNGILDLQSMLLIMSEYDYSIDITPVVAVSLPFTKYYTGDTA